MVYIYCKTTGFLASAALLACLGCSGGHNTTPEDSNSVADQNGLLDCSRLGNVDDPRCRETDCDFAGKVGKGVTLACAGSLTELMAGFVDESKNRLVLGLKSTRNFQIPNGVVLSVDLHSGDRTIVSGTYEDAAAGPVSRGDGQQLLDIQGMYSASDGAWLVATGNASARVIKIDPVSGNRSVVLDDTLLDCSAVTGLDNEALDYHTFIADDKNYYFALSHGHASGVVKVSSTTFDCSAVTLQSFDDESLDKGSGVSFASLTQFHRLLLQGNKVWALEYAPLKELLSFDLKTGERLRVSSLNSRVGAGEIAVGAEDMTLNAGAIWSLFEDFQSEGEGIGSRVELIPSDMPSGNRTAIVPKSGPATLNTDIKRIWPAPNSSLFILATEQGAVMWLDPASGASNLFSW